MPEIVKLTGYQKRWIEDRARLKHGRICRQGGKDFMETLEEVFECEEKKTSWLILSAGERQSKKTISQAKIHARAHEIAAEVLQETYEIGNNKYTAHMLGFPNGSEIIGLPANPDTARGWASNVFLNEFAFHKDSRAIFTALYPSITRGYDLHILSTPNGKNNKFYELDGNERYSHHVVDLLKAVADGLELRDENGNIISPEELMAGMGDDEAAAQEYLVQFIDEATAFITYELMAACEDPEIEIMPEWAATLVKMAQASYEMYRETKQEIPLDTEALFAGLSFAGDLYLGMDIARKRHLTVLWLDEKIGRVCKPAAVIALANAPFYMQKLILHALLSLPRLRRFNGDMTGIGAQLCEQAGEMFGSWKVEGVNFTVASKEALAGKFKESLEDRRRILPAEHFIRNSIHSVKRYTTPTGHFRYDAEATEKTGHGDYFWAAALSEMAAGGPSVEAGEVRRNPENRRAGETAARQSLVFGERRPMGMREALRAGRQYGI